MEHRAESNGSWREYNANPPPNGSKSPTKKLEASKKKGGWRAKLYKLNSESKWVAQGTGMVECKYIDRINNNALQFIADQESGSPGKVLLEAVIATEDVYQLQQDMIIVWNEPSNNMDLALSFEDVRGCEDIWCQLCSFQGRFSADYRSRNAAGGARDEEEMCDGEQQHGSRDLGLESNDINNQVIELPAPSIQNLDRIAELVASGQSDMYTGFILGPVIKHESGAHSGDNDGARNGTELEEKEPNLESNEVLRESGYDARKRNEATRNNETYLSTLLALFPKLEAEQDIENLHNLFSILRSLVMYNQPALLEEFLSDKYFERFVGILEYDPDIIPRPRHRDFLRSEVEHKMVVPIKDPEVVEKIHQCFRVRFLKDVLLPRALDEKSIALLGDIDTMNGVHIATALHSDPEYLKGIFDLLRSEDRKQRADGLGCLQELCSLAKRMQVPNRNAFYRSLIHKSENLFGMFESILGDEKSSVTERLNIGDILKLALQHDPAELRTFIIQEVKEPQVDEGSQSRVDEESQSQVDMRSICELLDRVASDSTDSMQTRLAKQRNLFAAPSSYTVPPAGEPAGPAPKLTLMAQLLKRLVHDPEAGMQAQASEILRTLLDPETMEVNEKENFLDLFYKRYIQWLILPLEMIKVRMSPTPRNQRRTIEAVDPPESEQQEYQLVLSSGLLDAHTVQNFSDGSKEDQRAARKASDTARIAEHHITELLSFCVQTQGFRIKYFVLHQDILSKVLRLLYSKDKHLVLGAIRFARTCVGLKDEFYNRHIVRLDLFARIFEIFSANGPRNNLINSAVMELLEFISMENIDVLVNYVVQKFGNQLQSIDYVDTYEKLRDRYRSNTIAAAQATQPEENGHSEYIGANHSGRGRTTMFQGGRPVSGARRDSFPQIWRASNRNSAPQDGGISARDLDQLEDPEIVKKRNVNEISKGAEDDATQEALRKKSLVPYGDDEEEDPPTNREVGQSGQALPQAEGEVIATPRNDSPANDMGRSSSSPQPGGKIDRISE